MQILRKGAHDENYRGCGSSDRQWQLCRPLYGSLLGTDRGNHRGRGNLSLKLERRMECSLFVSGEEDLWRTFDLESELWAFASLATGILLSWCKLQLSLTQFQRNQANQARISVEVWDPTQQWGVIWRWEHAVRWRDLYSHDFVTVQRWTLKYCRRVSTQVFRDMNGVITWWYFCTF